MHELPCNLHSPSLPYGQLVIFHIAERYKVKFFHELPCSVTSLFTSHGPHEAIELKCTFYCQITLKTGLLQHDSHTLFDFSGVLHNVLAKDLHFPRSGTDKCSKHPYCCGLARSVWTKKAKYLTIFHIKRYSIYCVHVSVAFAQVRNVD